MQKARSVQGAKKNIHVDHKSTLLKAEKTEQFK